MDVPGAEPSDEDLAARAAAGDRSAFDELLHRYHAAAYRLAYRLVGAGGDPEDAVQDAFLQVLKHLKMYRGEAKVATWIFRIVTNAALMQRRARARRMVEPLDAFAPRFDADGVHADPPEILRAAGEAEERLDREALARRAMEGIERLPDTLRVPFVLRDLEEVPTADVALMLDLEPATVRQRVHRARVLLRGYLANLPEVRP